MSAPSNNQWRIAGAAGITPDPVDPSFQEVITQGIGFPLRPVDGVPFTSTPDIDALVAQGAPMQFMPDGWEQGKLYPSGAVLTNGLWTMVANKLTLDNPYPQPAGDPTFSLPTFTPLAQSNTSIVNSGNTWTFTGNAFVTAVRIWVTEISATTNYKVVIVTIPPGPDAVAQTATIPVTPTVTGEWIIIALANQLIVSGTLVTVYINALNTASDTNITGPWTYQGSTQTGAPAAQSWTVDNQRTNFRIDKTDSDGADRSAALEAVTVDSIITVTEDANVGNNGIYLVTNVIDLGTYMIYGVVIQNEGGGGPSAGSATTVSIDVPVPLPTEYAEELAGVGTPAWATMKPFLQYNDVNQSPASDTAFGTDIEADITAFSDDWDVMSYNA